MDILIGKTLLFTDMHFGLKQNAVSRLNICVKVVKQMLEKIKEENIQNVIFGGDLYHERVSVNVNTLNVALKCMQAVAKHCNTYLIVGNHDAHYKNSIEVNSLNMFKDTKNIHVIEKPTEVEINGSKMLLCPWLSDLSAYSKETYDFLVGHFDISSKFLIASYIEDNSKNLQASQSISDMIQQDNLLASQSSMQTATNDDFTEAVNTKKKASELVGDFVELVKRSGTIFSGHIHQHREFVAKRRKFIFIGSPYEQTRGDRGNECGYYILDENNKYKFIKTIGTPKHVELRMSKVIDVGIDKFDFSIVKGNILHKIYDCDVDRISDSKITQKITDYKPYDELIPDYEVSLNYNDGVNLQNETIALIKKSKLEYIKNYIDNIDKAVLSEQEIDAARLYKMLEEYYEKVTEQQ